MNINYLTEEKNEIEVEIDNPTIVEIIRVYLNKDSDVSLAVWKREHPSKNPVLKIKTKGKTAKKALTDAISNLDKDLDKLEKDFKKAK